MLLRVAILLMAPLLAAAQTDPESINVAFCHAINPPPDTMFQQHFFKDDGAVELLLLSNNKIPCAGNRIKVNSQVLWAGLAPEELGKDHSGQIGLQGDFLSSPNSITEVVVIGNDPTTHTAVTNAATLTEQKPFALNRSFINDLKPQLFGIEERATLPKQKHLKCTPGKHIAGLFLSAQQPLAQGHNLQLEISARGQGQFGILIGDSKRDRNETPLSLGEIELNELSTSAHQFNLPSNLLPWTSLTVVCPQAQGNLALSSLLIKTVPTATPERDLQRGAWFWSPELWRTQQAFIWQTQKQEQLSEIYISVPIDDNGDIPDSKQLAQFISRASSRSLQVWAVIGDPHDVLPAHQAAVDTRVNAFLRYNKSVARSSQLAGVQLDIEPYLLPGFSRSQGRWRERYVAVVQRVHRLLNGEMRMDLVMPAWWGTHPAWGELLFSGLPTENTRVSIMNYHTNLERLKANADPFLDWGQRHNVAIQVALELGTLNDEHQRRYRAHADTGELWLMAVGDKQVLILFDGPQSQLAGKPFAYAFEYKIPASLYSFAGKKTLLSHTITELEKDWRQWSSFSGISVHGLDDKNLTEGAQ